MRLLLDTHACIWAVTGDRALTAAARRLMTSAEAVYVSAVSILEVAIKAPLGKIDADCDESLAAIEASGFIELPVSARHTSAVAKLPALHKESVRPPADDAGADRAVAAAQRRPAAASLQRVGGAHLRQQVP